MGRATASDAWRPGPSWPCLGRGARGRWLLRLIVPPVDEAPQTDRPLNALVVGTDDWAVDQAVAALAARGRRPLTCHRSGEPAFPCNALVDGRTCPLDMGSQVVGTVRARSNGIPAQAELGVVCGLHAVTELVVAGVSANNPFERWRRRAVPPGGDLVTECERAAEAAASLTPTPIRTGARPRTME